MQSQGHVVTYLSSPAPVNMGDWWFDVATTGHFWIRRRFEVTQKIADATIRGAHQLAEIGCGNGLLQEDIEECYGKGVVGFELNQVALEKNISSSSPLYCYDIHQRNPEFRARFDLIFLFDVLEHIDDESGFLQSVKFHSTKSGSVLINVPAHQELYSEYDRAAGHVRRYSAQQLKAVAKQNGFRVRAFTYWGLPLVPLLLLRKAMRLQPSKGGAGFDPGGKVINSVLSGLAKCEPLPQRFFGTSVMALLVNES